jgi:hypothetical protein
MAILQRRTARLLVAITSACATKNIPPGPPTPHEATEILASRGRTWDVVIEFFADGNIPIRTMDRASGFIATELLGVHSREATAWADCGRKVAGGFAPQDATLEIVPTLAIYNVLVRGDSSSSTAKITVRWSIGAGAGECSTRGRWEVEAEQDIKLRAEAAGPRR